MFFSIFSFTIQLKSWQTNESIKSNKSRKSIDIVLGSDKGFVVTEVRTHSPGQCTDVQSWVQRPIGYPGAPKCARIWTHNLLKTSLLPLPLDRGSRRLLRFLRMKIQTGITWTKYKRTNQWTTIRYQAYFSLPITFWKICRESSFCGNGLVC